MKNRLYMVSAWAVCNGLCLGQQNVDGKSNEITAIPELVKALAPAQCIVAIDATGCQKSNNRDNYKCRSGLYSVCQRQSEEDQIYLPYKQSYFQQNDGHGRKEYRKCVCDTAF